MEISDTKQVANYWESLRAALLNPNSIYPRPSVEALLAKIDQADFRNFTDADGHLTGSALILDATSRFVLLIHHPKLKKWIQPGGHIDPGESPHQTAARESLEETGLADLILQSEAPLDIDVHEIPAGKTEAHRHYDLRFEFRYAIKVTQESEWTSELPCRWIRLENVASICQEESVLRMIKMIQNR